MSQYIKCNMQMKYTWIDYCGAYEAGVEALFDSEAVKFTGCDDGFLAFYDYWRRELKEGEFFAKVILDGGELIGVAALARAEDGVFTVQEFVIAPKHRGKGVGTAALTELINNSKDVIDEEIKTAEAVIFPKNIASQRAFSKAGFKEISRDEGGIRYVYEK